MTTTKKFLSLVLILAVFILSACRVVVDTNVNEDGSGKLQSSVVFSAEEKQNFANSPNNAGKSICDNLKEGIEPEAEFVEEVKENETFCTTVRSFANLSELQNLYNRMGDVSVNTMKMSLGKLVFDIQVDLTPRNGNEPAPSEWRVTVPGKIQNHNADNVEGQTLIWNVAPGAVRTLHIESALEPNALFLIFMSGAILLLGIVAGLMIARNLARHKGTA